MTKHEFLPVCPTYKMALRTPKYSFGRAFWHFDFLFSSVIIMKTISQTVTNSAVNLRQTGEKYLRFR